MRKFIALAGLAGLLFSSPFPAAAETPAADPRFTDHGIPAPVSLGRGSAATLDSQGRRVLLIWQTDIGQLLAVNIEDGSARQFALPDFPAGGGSFAVMQARTGRWYTHAGPWAKPGTFYEFDPKTMTFTNHFQTRDTYAMSFHEDADGVIWTALYPHAQLISYDPKNGKVTDHGNLNDENWPQYPRCGLARDRSGWVYTIIGFTKCQILGYQPQNGEKRAFLPDSERGRANNDADSIGEIFTGQDGKAYARTVTTRGMQWFRLWNGKAEKLDRAPDVPRVPERSHGVWGNFSDFPDGSRVVQLDVPFRRLTVREADGTERRLTFDYRAPGAKMMNVFNGPDGGIYGTTAYPRFVFRFDPPSGQFFLHPDTHAGGHWNSWAVRGSKLYGAFYPWGMIREIDTARPWSKQTGLNLAKEDYGKSVKGDPHIHRPNILLLHPDGNHLILGGTPDYGHTGGGLLIWNPETGKQEIFTHEQMIPNQNTVALAALPDGNLVGATSTAPGTGGEKLARQPEIYLLDWNARKIINRQPLPGQADAADLLIEPDGRIWLLDRNAAAMHRYAVSEGKLHLRQTISIRDCGNPVDSAGNRVMIRDPQRGDYVILFDRSLVRFAPDSGKYEKLADLPVKPYGSLAIAGNRIYFGSGSHLWSFQPTTR